MSATLPLETGNPTPKPPKLCSTMRMYEITCAEWVSFVASGGLVLDCRGVWGSAMSFAELGDLLLPGFGSWFVAPELGGCHVMSN